MSELSDKVVVAGVGYSQIGRSTGRSEGSLAVEASKAALEDAGLTVADLDGIAMWPDRVSSVFEGPSIVYMYRALGLRDVRYYQAMGAGPGWSRRRSCSRSSCWRRTSSSCGRWPANRVESSRARGKQIGGQFATRGS